MLANSQQNVHRSMGLLLRYVHRKVASEPDHIFIEFHQCAKSRTAFLGADIAFCNFFYRMK